MLLRPLGRMISRGLVFGPCPGFHRGIEEIKSLTADTAHVGFLYQDSGSTDPVLKFKRPSGGRFGCYAARLRVNRGWPHCFYPEDRHRRKRCAQLLEKPRRKPVRIPRVWIPGRSEVSVLDLLRSLKHRSIVPESQMKPVGGGIASAVGLFMIAVCRGKERSEGYCTLEIRR